jgi:hypothetical protein
MLLQLEGNLGIAVETGSGLCISSTLPTFGRLLKVAPGLRFCA